MGTVAIPFLFGVHVVVHSKGTNLSVYRQKNPALIVKRIVHVPLNGQNGEIVVGTYTLRAVHFNHQ